jgi:tetratricopeptide (TPR) repeat protein
MMAKHLSRTQQWAFLGLGILLLVTAVAAGYAYRVEQKFQAAQAKVLLEQGMSEFREDEFEKSLQTLNNIPADAVDDWRIPYYSGSALIKLKDYERAAPVLEHALALNNNEKNILFALGVVYYKLGNLSLSKGYFAAVLEIDPGHEEAKGLMDIMAGLERYSAENAAEPDT